MDCEWLRELHSVGLLRPSFRPAAAIVPLRSFMRQRETLVEEISARILRRQKALTQMNVMLHVVVTDITGETGLKIVRHILAGERDPERLAAQRNYRCHASTAEIIAALTGDYRAVQAGARGIIRRALWRGASMAIFASICAIPTLSRLWHVDHEKHNLTKCFG
jgi:hypothetical protein